MQTFTDTVQSLWQVLAIGLLFGAGIPIVFAFGMRFLSTTDATDGVAAGRSVGATAAGYACFAICLVAVVTGVLFITKDFLANDLGIHLF